MMNHWIFWALLSAVFAGLTAVLAKVGVSGIDSNLATAIRTTVILIFTWAIAIGVRWRRSDATALFAGVSGHAAWFLILSGLATGASWLCYFRALQLGEASRVAPVDKISVLFVIAFAAIWLKEPVGWLQWLGGSLILAGAILLAWRS